MIFRAAFDHPLPDLAADHELRVQVRLHDLVPQLVGVLGGGLAENRARVVDEDVDHRALRFDLPQEVVNAGAIREVAGVAREPPPDGQHFLLDRAARSL